jgi:multidrug efflux pump subunit AcrB
LHRSELHPDAWRPAIIRNPADTEARLQQVAGPKYSCHDLENYTDLMQRTLQGVPETSLVQRSAVLPETIYLDYSQERLAQYGHDPSKLKDILGAQNITLPAGSLDVGTKDLVVNPSGLFPDAQAIGNVIIGKSASNSPVYLRDLVDISRAYQNPATYLNFLTLRDKDGKWVRSRAVTLAVYMRAGQQINLFGQHVTEKMDALKLYLPDDLIVVHTSDQVVQVKEQINLFMDALYEAIGLVVLVSLMVSRIGCHRTESSGWTISGRCRCTPSLLRGTLRQRSPQSRSKLRELEKKLAPGYGLSFGGEYDKQKVGFRNLGVVLAISISAIYLALLFQFNNAIKPLLVFAAAPYGVAGALIALWIMISRSGSWPSW